MAIVENAGVDLGMSMGSFEEAAVAAVASQDSGHHINNDQDQPKNNNQHLRTLIVENNNVPVLVGPHDPTLYMKVHPLQAPPPPAYLSTKPHQVVVVPDHLEPLSAHIHRSNNGEDMPRSDSDVDESYKRDMTELEEMFSKLNPMAEEFVPLSLSQNGPFFTNNSHFSFRNGDINGLMGRRKKSNYSQGKRRINSRTSMAQREDIIRRTVYVSDIDHQITEEQLAGLFLSCGQVVDCRVCGDPNSVLRFAFVEFTDEEGAQAALNLAGTMLGYYPVRVLPSKTAIAPVNPTFLPRNEDEREMCARTIYCTNIDKKVSQSEIILFFESVCGEVYRLRLLGDYHHSTRIVFVEFVMLDPDSLPDIAQGELRADMFGRQVDSQPYADRDGSGSSTPHFINYAVSPRELTIRLHEVLKSRLEERVKELETALQNSGKKVRYTETERTEWRVFSNSEAGSSSIHGSPIAKEEDLAEQPVVIHLSGDAVHAYNEAYDELTKVDESEEGLPSGVENDHQESLHNFDQDLCWTENGGLNSYNPSHSISNRSGSPAFVHRGEEDNSTSSNGISTSGHEDDSGDDEMERYLIKQILEKTRQGSPAVLKARKILFSMDESEHRL